MEFGELPAGDAPPRLDAASGDASPLDELEVRLRAALADARALRIALDEIEEWRAAAYVTQAEDRIATLIAHLSPPGHDGGGDAVSPPGARGDAGTGDEGR